MGVHCSCDPGSPGHLARNFEEFVMRIIAFIALLAVSASTAFAGSTTLKSNTDDFWIPDGTGSYVHSPITISEAPAGSVVSSISWGFYITHADGRDLDVDLNDHTKSLS
jgi:hypothetical protein